MRDCHTILVVFCLDACFTSDHQTCKVRRHWFIYHDILQTYGKYFFFSRGFRTRDLYQEPSALNQGLMGLFASR